MLTASSCQTAPRSPSISRQRRLDFVRKVRQSPSGNRRFAFQPSLNTPRASAARAFRNTPHGGGECSDFSSEIPPACRRSGRGARNLRRERVPAAAGTGEDARRLFGRASGQSGPVIDGFRQPSRGRVGRPPVAEPAADVATSAIVSRDQCCAVQDSDGFGHASRPCRHIARPRTISRAARRRFADAAFTLMTHLGDQ